jgi:hypothetical protein
VTSLSPLVTRVLASAGPASDFLCPLQLVFLTIECLPRFFCSLLDPALTFELLHAVVIFALRF